MGSPGSMRRSMPSRPAISMAANARYPLQDGSGVRNSTRFARGIRRIHRNPTAGGTVALRVDQIDRRFIARNEPTVGICRRSAKSAECPGVLEQAADVVASELAELCIVRLTMEQVGIALP